jgi:hypothetical protein
MNKDQSFTWELLLLLGITVILISPIGNWLADVVKEIATYHNVQLNFGFGGLGNSQTSAHTAPTQSGGGSNPSLFNVPIVNSNGEAGTIQVVASDAASALTNATQGGNRPTGNAIPA